MVVLWMVLAIVAVILAVVVIRAAMFRPHPVPQKTYDKVDVDTTRAVEGLRQLVMCRTVSYDDPSLEDEAAFAKLASLIPELFPHVVATCKKIDVHHRAMLYLWEGQNHGKEGAKASVLMAHYDVVPVEEDNWEKPPFDGIMEDEVLWGRGTIDTKATFNGILMAANDLIAKGFVPKEDIYLAFSGGEETNGPGAIAIVDYFKENKIELSMVVDEGGAVVEDVFPGVRGQCALIGTAEKGMINLKYTVMSGGGHASAPGRHTPIGVLASAVKAVEDQPMTMRITKPVEQMFDTLGRHSSFVYRMIFANLWLFRPLIGMITKKGGELNALVRTTVAFTQMRGSKAPNVIPPRAEVVSNIRINPAESIASVMRDITARVGNENVRVEQMGDYAMEPSPISRTDVEGWERVVDAVRGTWPGAIVSPYLMMQCSDARHYRDLSDRVYRFSAMHMTREERSTIHGNNERVTFREAAKAVEFFTRVMLAS